MPITLAPATVQQSDLFSVTAAVEQFDPDLGCMVREDYLFAVQRKPFYTHDIKAWVEANCTIGGVSPNLIDLFSDEWKTAADDRIAELDGEF